MKRKEISSESIDSMTTAKKPCQSLESQQSCSERTEFIINMIAIFKNQSLCRFTSMKKSKWFTNETINTIRHMNKNLVLIAVGSSYYNAGFFKEIFSSVKWSSEIVNDPRIIHVLYTQKYQLYDKITIVSELYDQGLNLVDNFKMYVNPFSVGTQCAGTQCVYIDHALLHFILTLVFTTVPKESFYWFIDYYHELCKRELNTSYVVFFMGTFINTMFKHDLIHSGSSDALHPRGFDPSRPVHHVECNPLEYMRAKNIVPNDYIINTLLHKQLVTTQEHNEYLEKIAENKPEYVLNVYPVTF